MDVLRLFPVTLLLMSCGVVSAGPVDTHTAPMLRKTVAVGGFDNRGDGAGGADTQIAERLADQLSDALVQTGAFVVLERERSLANMDPYGVDPVFQNREGPVQEARSVSTMAAQIVIKGTVTDFSIQAAGSRNGLSMSGVRLGASKSVAQVGLIVRVIDSSSQQVLASRRVEGKVKSRGVQLGLDIEGANYEGENFKETPLGQAGQIAIDEAVRLIVDETRNLPYLARVVKVDDGRRAVISCGAPGGVESGMRFEVMSVGGELRDPLTGELLGFDQHELGVVTVERVFDRFAYVRRSLASSRVMRRAYQIQAVKEAITKQ